MASDYNRTVRDDDRNFETPDVSGISNPDVSHEVNDINVFAIVKFVIGLGAAVALVFVLMGGMMRVLEYLESRKDVSSPMARTGADRLPQSDIKLQGAEGHVFKPEQMTVDPDLAKQLTRQQLDFQLKEAPAEWRELRRIKIEELNSYGRLGSKQDNDQFETPSQGLHIPIDDAKKKLLENNQAQVRQLTPEQTNADGFDLMPTLQSAGQRAERRKQ